MPNEKLPPLEMDAEINLGEFHGDLKQLVGALEKLDPSLREAERGMNKVERASREAGKSAGFLKSTFVQLTGSFTAANLAADVIRRGFRGMFEVLKTGFTAPINEARKFETVLARISTVVEGSTKESIRALGDEILEMSKRFPKSRDELGIGLYNILQAGVEDTSDAMRLLELSTKAAIGGVTEVGTAAKVATDIMGAYNLTVDETERVMDAVFVGAQRGKAEFEDLSGALGNTLQSAAQLDVQIPEVVAAIETMVNAGLSADEAATSLNSFFTAVINASKGTGDAAALAKQLGLQFDSTALRTKGLQKFMEDMADAVGDNEVAMNILSGNVRGFRAAASIGGKGAEFFADTLEAMREEVGALDEAFAKNADTLDNFIILAKNELIATITEAGQESLPELKESFEELKEVIADNEEQIKDAAGALSGSLVNGIQAVVERGPEIIKALEGIAKAASAIVNSILFVQDFAGAATSTAQNAYLEALADPKKNPKSHQMYRNLLDERAGKSMQQIGPLRSVAPFMFRTPTDPVHAEALGRIPKVLLEAGTRGTGTNESETNNQFSVGSKSTEGRLKEIDKLEKEITKSLQEQAKINRDILKQRKEDLELKREIGIITSREEEELRRINNRMEFAGDLIDDLTKKWKDQKRAIEESKDTLEEYRKELRDIEEEMADVDEETAESRIEKLAELIRERNDLKEKFTIGGGLTGDASRRVGEINEILNTATPEELTEAERLASLNPLQLITEEGEKRKAQLQERKDELLGLIDAERKGLEDLRQQAEDTQRDIAQALKDRATVQTQTYTLLETATTNHVNQQIAEFNRLKATLDSLTSASRNIATFETQAGQSLSSSFSVPGFKDGGVLHGPGGPRSDNLLIAASPGERIISAATNRLYGPILDAIHRREFPIPRFADGGVVNSHNQTTKTAHFHYHGEGAKAMADPTMLNWQWRKMR